MKKKSPSRRASSGKPRRTTRSPRVARKVRKPRQNSLRDDKLRNNILFTNVATREYSAILPKLIRRRYKAGQTIFDESTHGRDLYLIVKGRIRIKKHTRHGVESLLAVLHEGDFFGELAIIDGLPRSARAEAVDDSVIVIFKSTEFRKLVKDSDALTYNLLKNLAIRLRTLDQTFVLELERNALAWQNKMDKLNHLIEVSAVVNSTIDIDRLLGVVLDAAARSIRADRGTLYLIDEASGELWSKVMQGKDMVDIRLPAGKGLAGYVARTGETVSIADAYSDARFNPEIDRRTGYTTRNVLCMPMRNKDGKIAGVFQFLNKDVGPFTDEDTAFINAFSVHASIALENARLAREMVSSERLSAVGRMAGSIIHDIKNPMGTLRVYAQVIKRRTEDAELSQMADEMIRQVDRFVKMTQDILDFSRGVSIMNMERVKLQEVMDTALTILAADLSKREVRLVQDFSFTGECEMDGEKMARVFFNLADNAAAAMQGGGTLTVRTSSTPSELLIEFSDTGVGMNEEIRSRIFEPFFTFGKKQGTGLGLSIVKKIIDDHQGSIEVESQVNMGTTFRIRLPLAGV